MKTLITIFCMCCTALLSPAQTIQQVEYFIDKDKGAGNNTKINLTSASDSTYDFNINLSALSVGIHKLYIRTKDSKGKWSLTAGQSIEVTPSLNQLKIIAGEYFFDADPGYGKGKIIALSSADIDIAKSFTAATASLNQGYHALYTRFKDSLGNWSITSQRSVEIVKTADTIKLVAAEYFFVADKGFANGAAKILSKTFSDGKVSIKIPYNQIPAGASVVFIRVKDSLNNWSLTKLDTFSVQSFAKTLVPPDAIINSTIFSIFPNPASENIQVHYRQKGIHATIQIVDMNGKTVLQTTLQHENNTINIGRLAQSTYLLQLKDGDITQVAKFIKQ